MLLEVSSKVEAPINQRISSSSIVWVQFSSNQKYSKVEKSERGPKFIFLKYFGKNFNIFYNFKVNNCRSLIMCRSISRKTTIYNCRNDSILSRTGKKRL
jgi:hypothetical protein